MADDPPTHPPLSSANVNSNDQQVQLEAKVEDAETRAAREELKHTAISDKRDPSTGTDKQTTQTHHGGDDEDEEMKPRSGLTYEYVSGPPRKKTPDLAPIHTLSHADVAGEKKPASPKKKRAHDEVEQHKEGEGNRTSSGAESEGWVVIDAAENDKDHRSEPQKKRARDETSPPADIHKTTAVATSSLDSSTTETATKDDQPARTSASAFADSGFSKLASSSRSPFASVGTTKSVFGGGTASSTSPFASLGAPSPSKPAAPPSLPKPTLSFGNNDPSAPSPFASVNGSAGSGFGSSAFGGGSTFGGSSTFGGGSAFGSVLGGSRIGNFATPGAPPIIKSDKPAKPFGAPESDVEDESDDDSDSDQDEARGSGADGEKEKDDAASRDESTPVGGEDEKKAKYKKVVVDDGEAGEAAIAQVRARMYYLDKSTNAQGKEEIGWRERGAGILKINVPIESVNIDSESGAADPKSFDRAILSESTPASPKLVRLLMRQDSTLRVILNTAMSAHMKFELREGLKANNVLFTAIEGEDAKHVQVQMKMSQQSADAFLKAIEGIQRKMRGDDA